MKMFKISFIAIGFWIAGSLFAVTGSGTHTKTTSLPTAPRGSGVHTGPNILSANENIAFWAGQFKDHADYAAGFTTDSALKTKGAQLQDEAMQVQNNTKRNMNISHYDEFKKLSADMKNYQSKVRKSLKQNKDLAIQKDLLDHMDLETDYALKKASGKELSKEEEIKFWSKEHEGEAKAIAYFTQDPNVKTDASDLSKAISKISNVQLQNIEHANQELSAINPAQTNLPGNLAEHEAREREYAAQIFKYLEQKAQK